MGKMITLSDDPEYNRKFAEKRVEEYLKKIETDPDFVKRKRLSPLWPDIERVAREKGVKLADEK